jgi:hypothetical protein
MIAIVRTDEEARQLGSETPVFTVAEVAVAIEALGKTALEAKRVFLGAIVTAVRSGSQESTGQPIDKNRESKRTPARPKAKPLAPSGSYQSLSKKMPADTRYKGESFPAGNLKERYQEQIAKQRAAATLVRADRDD